MHTYRDSIKSDISDELINTYVLRPVAGVVVWILYRTPVTPNQVTLASIVSGLVAAFFYGTGTPDAWIVGGLLITLKDVLDSADGQLARAKHLQSRMGRFLDSIGDFIVDAAVFGAIGWTLSTLHHDWSMLLLALLGFIGITLRVSYHVFYQVQYLHLQEHYRNNRITEEIREEDLKKGRVELTLQRIFQFIYGWQDRWMVQIDRWCMKRARDLSGYTQNGSPENHVAWYSNRFALLLSGLLGFGTELFLLMICSVFQRIELYLYINVVVMNGILLINIMFRRVVLYNHCFIVNDEDNLKKRRIL
jgi:phosphatidylglycerophosphate synthase